MFNLMRMLLSGKGGTDPRDLRLDDLHEGWQVGFGFMAQSGLSGRRFTVTELRRYRFGNDNYTSYTLEDNDYKVYLVPARDDEGVPYIAISRLIEISDLTKIVDANSLNMAMEQDKTAALHVRNIPRHLKGWINAGDEYKRALKKIEGTVSAPATGETAFGGKEPQAGLRRIYYSLFVNDKGSHAIEVEQLANGRKRVYATVYRPATDIGQIARPGGGGRGRGSELIANQQESSSFSHIREVPLTLSKGGGEYEHITVHTPPTLKDIENKDVKIIDGGKSGLPRVDVGGEGNGTEKTAAEEDYNDKSGDKADSISGSSGGDSCGAGKEAKRQSDGETALLTRKKSVAGGGKDAANTGTADSTKTEESKSKRKKERKKQKQQAASTETKKPEEKTYSGGEAITGAGESKGKEGKKEKEKSRDKNEDKNEGELVAVAETDIVASPTAAKISKTDIIMPQPSEAQMVSCNMKVASKVIDEAVNSGLTLTQVVRKIMDLPAATDETVQLRLKLTEKDRRELGKRYGIDAEDPRAIAEVINRELNLFVGEDA